MPEINTSPRYNTMDIFHSGVGALRNFNNPFEGVNLGNIENLYGMHRNVSGLYDNAKSNLSSSLGNARAGATSRAASRMGNSATPGRTFSGIEGEYANSLGAGLGNIEQSQAQAQLGQDTNIAEFLRAIQGQGANLNMQRAGSLINAGETWRQLDSADSPPGFMDYLSAIMGPAAQIGAAALTGGASLPVTAAASAASH